MTKGPKIQDTEEFRDAISTVDKEGKRIWVYPKKPSGPLYKYRSYVSYALLAFLFLAPFVSINGEPLLLFNIIERKFVLFGQVFWPQDFQLFLFAMITGVVFIILFTVVYGRIFCGWICPQTIFMEMLFRKIEYFIEGDWKAQKALNKKKWTREYIFKKTTKQLIFLAISFHIANTFLAYIIGADNVLKISTSSPLDHLTGFLAVVAFTGAFYGIFSHFREQVCTTVCPYGRLQGVLLDKNSIVVAYDYIRGENRGKVRKGEDRAAAGKGDCIDCHQCVNVCPTGIDIRNGTQLECINCTACIDACNYMMEKVNLPKGLIRYASEAEIAEKRPFTFTTRTKAYTGVLSVLIIALVVMLSTRSDVETSILRTPGMLYQEPQEGIISNLYNYKIVNKTNDSIPVRFQLAGGINGNIQLVGKPPGVNGNDIAEGALFVRIPKEAIKQMKTKLKIEVYSDERKLETVNTTFIGPTI